MLKRIQALKRALEIARGKRALCSALWLSYEDLDGYLSGKKQIPDSVYQASLDVIARNRKYSW